MDERTRRRNRGFLIGLLGLAFGMVGLAYASVPLYSLFCQVTGFGGTTQRAEKAPDTVLDRTVTVRFNADVNTGLPWSFRPNQREVTVKLGETVLVSYHAENRGKEPLTGTAVFNVTPEKTGAYFNKIECFCFTEQVLNPGEAVDMPVAFFVDPAIVNDRDAEDVKTITLSYTFFRAKTGAASSTKERTAARPGETGATN
ncbi:cytochrome c oxidase assembly protein [Azospirillum sp. TSO22-1]|uniref:cytochrome c oxidase assembly protein n=1 Tax=Azospirillum sp. TSO22-1 TaxID=716789 RepID=UPI000D61B634|nr:cytochrome c oxidase assembly protein [Azospirillum sp. TSO22-1]PWC56372.1 cytochrome C oxidase assembly protein [Azospirillum sp. TSO22-1]